MDRCMSPSVSTSPCLSALFRLSARRRRRSQGIRESVCDGGWRLAALGSLAVRVAGGIPALVQKCNTNGPPCPMPSMAQYYLIYSSGSTNMKGASMYVLIMHVYKYGYRPVQGTSLFETRPERVLTGSPGAAELASLFLFLALCFFFDCFSFSSSFILQTWHFVCPFFNDEHSQSTSSRPTSSGLMGTRSRSGGTGTRLNLRSCLAPSNVLPSFNTCFHVGNTRSFGRAVPVRSVDSTPPLYG